MTAIAALVAEAIAFAREATSDRVRNHPRTTWLSGDVEGMTVLDPVRYHRDDVVDAALAHLVARVVGAEGHADGEWEGRQAAIRAEVEHGAAWLEDQADRVPPCMGADRAEASLRAKAADCRRWLEATS